MNETRPINQEYHRPIGVGIYFRAPSLPVLRQYDVGGRTTREMPKLETRMLSFLTMLPQRSLETLNLSSATTEARSRIHYPH